MSHQGKLSGKVALVTGGSMGLGEGIVRKFVQEGARVLVFDINRSAGEKVVSSLSSEAVAFFEGDVTKEEDWHAALKAVLERFGALDVVVNNAGVVHRSAVSPTSLGTGGVVWRRLMGRANASPPTKSRWQSMNES